MALVSKDSINHLVPDHEPESWFDVRPITARDYSAMGNIDISNLNAGVAIEASLALLAKVIVAWSYDAEITPETVGDLDAETYAWLVDAANLVAGIRSLREKKALPLVSIPGPPRAAASGRRS